MILFPSFWQMLPPMDTPKTVISANFIPSSISISNLLFFSHHLSSFPLTPSGAPTQPILQPRRDMFVFRISRLHSSNVRSFLGVVCKSPGPVTKTPPSSTAWNSLLSLLCVTHQARVRFNLAASALCTFTVKHVWNNITLVSFYIYECQPPEGPGGHLVHSFHLFKSTSSYLLDHQGTPLTRPFLNEHFMPFLLFSDLQYLFLNSDSQLMILFLILLRKQKQ